MSSHPYITLLFTRIPVDGLKPFDKTCKHLIFVGPKNQLYSICELDDNQKEKWKDLVVTETTNERYHYDLRRIAQRTDWQFSYPRKFNIKHSKVS